MHRSHPWIWMSCLLLSLSLIGCPSGPRASGERSFKAEPYRALVEKLASDEMEGRGVRTEGNRKATALLVERFKAAGLSPGMEEGYVQCFEQTVSVAAENVALAVDGKVVASADVAASAISSSGSFDGELVFVGYGIVATELGYDDYANIDVRDKIVVMMRFEPQESDTESVFNGERPSRYSEVRRKVFEARERGARAVLLVAPPRPGEEPDKSLPATESEAVSAAGLPVLHVLPSVVDTWLAVHNTSLENEVKAIDASLVSTPRVLGAMNGEVKMARASEELCNVIGVLPGEGALADEAVVIGAHFDHLGYGQQGSMSPGVQDIHHGADDNASGTAGLVAIAEAFEGMTGERRAIVFIAFNGEEVGLTGSSIYVQKPVFDLSKTQAMLNMDMIGRLRDGKLSVLGAETSDVWGAWLEEANAGPRLELNLHGDGYGPSDQTPFYAGGVPVLHFFTGSHEDYHKPSDTADKVNYEGAIKILVLVAGVAEAAARHDEKIAYQETSAGPTMAGDSRGYGAYLGTIPDYSSMSPGASGGVLLSGVRGDGPAAQAGLKGGDVIVEMAGRQIETLYDMTYVLRDHRPGDVMNIVVLREDKRVVLAATLGSRKKKGTSSGGGHGGDPHGGGHGGDPHGGGHGSGGHGNPHAAPEGPEMDAETMLYPGEEAFLKNVRQLTFDGENAEAYFHPDGKRVVYQARGGDVACDRIYTLELESGQIEQVSNGEGRTTCAYYTWPEGEHILYASTHEADANCPPEPDHSQGYVWPIYPSFDIYLKRGDETVKLTDAPGYDAEATVCLKDGRTVFTSTRDGDLELYVLESPEPGAQVTQITDTPGYDGGAFFSPDCSRLVWRASRPEGDALKAYEALLKQDLVKPSEMEIFVAASDGSDAKQITKNGAANFAPYFLPDNRHVIFSSNVEGGGRNFDLFLIDADAADPEATRQRVTFSPVFEAFPMFSPDGKQIIFASNRNAKKRGDTNLFIADWIGP